MKKIYLLSLFALLFPSLLYSEPIDVETARQQAAEFLRQRPSSKGKRLAPTNKPLKLLHTQRQTDDVVPTLYVFGNEGREGFVVIAGDDAAITPVLGYSSMGKFNVDSIPCNLRYLLGEYGRQIAYVRKHPSSVKNSPSKTSKEAILPLTTSKWHQHEPFNNLCPIEDGFRCPTGCVATALAQIMYYHKWPEQGVGSYSYEWEWHDLTISADYGATPYQWDKMKDTYNGEDDDPDDAVATLMFHCGVATKTHYTTYGSMVLVETPEGRIEDRIERFMVNNFNYSYSPIDIQAHKLVEIDAILYNELSAQRPSLIIGGENEMHAFICDGYDNGYYHFNFGWGGIGDDYYLLSAITPLSYDFSSNLLVIYGIQKPGDEERVEIDGILFELYPDGTAQLVHGEPEGDYEMPSHIQVNGQSYEVTAIGDRAFANCGVSSVTIPNTVTSIGDAAFRKCGLHSVTIPNSVTSIGDAAFLDCWLLASVTIPNSITSISNSAFSGCYNLGSVVIPESVTSIGDGAFGGCERLTSLTIPKNVTFIGDGAFGGIHSSLTSIQVDSENTVYDSRNDCNALIETATNKLLLGCGSTIIPNDITSIGDGAFAGSNMTSVIIPYGVTSIGGGAFSYCKNLTTVTISETVTSIGNWAFQDCDVLTSVSIPGSVKTIGEYAFAWCKNIKSITISDGVISIGSGCFWDCESLLSITIPNSVTTIGEAAFCYCMSLPSVTLSNNMTKIESALFEGCGNLKTVNIHNSITHIGVVAFNDCGFSSITLPNSLTEIDNFAFSGCIYLTSLTIPNSVTSIKNFVFQNCSSLTSINIPEGIETIGVGLFDGCSSLKSVSIPNSVTKIISNDPFSTLTGAFNGCTSLEKVILPNNLSFIDEETFKDCTSLSSITIPASVTFIGDRAFSGCNSLTLVISKRETPVAISSDVFTNRANAILYVPFGCKEAYQTTELWSDFKEIIELPELMGDVNGDGKVSITDAVFVVNYVLQQPDASFCEQAADLNEDGRITITDAVMIVNTILHQGFNVKAVPELDPQ